jgi:hypothetical protein
MSVATRLGELLELLWQQSSEVMTLVPGGLREEAAPPAGVAPYARWHLESANAPEYSSDGRRLEQVRCRVALYGRPRALLAKALGAVEGLLSNAQRYPPLPALRVLRVRREGEAWLKEAEQRGGEETYQAQLILTYWVEVVPDGFPE